MKRVAYILILLLILPILDGCFKKAEEDPFLSLRSRKNRLKGKWKITKLEIQGDDYLNQAYDTTYYDGACQSDRIYHEDLITTVQYNFAKDGNVDISMSFVVTYTVTYTNPGYCNNYDGKYEGETSYSGEWDFTVGKKELVILSDDGFFEFYDIDKLSYEELKLSTQSKDFDVVIEGLKTKR